MKTLFLLLLLALPLAAVPRVFTDTKGRPLSAELVKSDATKVWLKLDSGKTTAVPKKNFSEADQAYITKWEKDLLPQTRVEPKFIRSNTKNDDDGYFYDSSRIQKFNMSIELKNLSTDKDLETSEIIYYLVGKSSSDDTYKILARQVATTGVPKRDSKEITFKPINNHYRDDKSYSSGHKGIGYVLLIQRKRDGRRIHLSTTSAPLESAIENIIRLKEGDVTGASFIKAPPVPSGRKKGGEPDTIIIR